MTDQLDDQTKKHFWIYILKLNQDKYYVGTTSQHDPQMRINQHANGFYSAQWVKKYGYLETVEIRDLGYITRSEAEAIEAQQTFDYIDKYGQQSVRGGELNYSGKYFFRFGRIFRDTDWVMMRYLMVLGLLFLLMSVAAIFHL